MSVDFWTDKHHVARKAYRCDGDCGTTIAPGQRYLRAGGKFDGDFFELTICCPCEELHGLVCKAVDVWGEDSPGVNGMRELLRYEGVADVEAWRTAQKAAQATEGSAAGVAL